ncbi:MAG: hypothetical protein WDZ52_14005 [Pseudohongiellaceae bacterium]
MGLRCCGATLAGEGIGGVEIGIAESLAGPVQTLMRIEADTDKYLAVLQHVLPEKASLDLAIRIQKRGRKLQGHWKATAYKSQMKLSWLEHPSGVVA